MAKFEPGQSGNPAGRPRGARGKLGEAFLEAILADFQQHGVAAIERLRIEHPDQYLKVIAGLLPRELNVTPGLGDADDLTDEELVRRLEAVQRRLSPWLVN